MAKPKSAPAGTDVLILHGRSLDLVDYFKEVFTGLGLKAHTVMDLPSLSRAQQNKVDHYIRHSRLALVLATFDEERPGSNTARPNVIDEIARCQRTKPRDTLVLIEQRNGQAVDLGSNTHGNLVSLPFGRQEIHRVVPKLLTEVRARDLFAGSNGHSTTFEAGRTLHEFLDRMDDLWDNQLDEAWNKIHRLDFAAESSFAHALDHFFVIYQGVFSAMVRDGHRGGDLKAKCDEGYRKALDIVATAWEAVCESKMKKADEHIASLKTAGHSRKGQQLYDKASREQRLGRRAEPSSDKIKHFRAAVVLVEEYLDPKEDGR